MSLLPRYLFRQYLSAFLLCVAVCAWVLLMIKFLPLFNLAVMKGISFGWMLACFARLLPYVFSLSIPMAFLVALLLTLGQLSESGEVMALRSSGFSFPEILWPFFVLATALSLFLLYLNHSASPEGFHSFKNAYHGALAQISRLDLEPDTFSPLGDWTLFAHETDKKQGAMRGVYLIKLKGSQRNIRIDAPEGQVSLKEGEGFELKLFRGTMHWPDADPSKLVSASFGAYRLFVPLGPSKPAGRDAEMQEINTVHLREQLGDAGLETAHRKEIATEIALRSAAALTPFAFFWLGCPLGLALEKHARAAGFALSLLVLFLYYGLLAAGIGLGRRDSAFSSAGPWLPVAAGLAGGGLMWVRNLRR